jgi:hypothetical protein
VAATILIAALTAALLVYSGVAMRLREARRFGEELEGPDPDWGRQGPADPDSPTGGAPSPGGRRGGGRNGEAKISLSAGKEVF